MVARLRRLVEWPHWRAVVARLPLPMLALAASYGVFRFASLFVPTWVAVVQAAAFELVYIGLAVVQLEGRQRRRAQGISIGSVIVSVLYNTLDGLFHRRPGMLDQPPLWGDIALAVLHGLPLAVLAYLVADLLLHAQGVSESFEGVREPVSTSHNGGGRPSVYTLDSLLLALDGEEQFTRDLALRRLACSEATIDRVLAEGVQAGILERLERGRYRVRG